MKRWVLVEDPGPWGYDALTQNRLPRGVMAEVKPWADSVRARVVLIRRGLRRSSEDRRIFVVSSQRGNEWISALTTGDLGTLTSIDEAAFASGRGIPGEGVSELYLVCTHGRHDRCCSVRGNPVARALCPEHESVWECSHIGGDRFAANLVCLPLGAYFGRVAASDAPRLIEAYESGSLDLECFRGWSSLPFAVQAAEAAVRINLALDDIDDVVPESWEKTSPTEVAVRMSISSMGPLDVVVSIGKSDDSYYLTCRAIEPAHPPLFETTTRVG